MKIRIKFAKSGMMRFIGHLDMMRYFQKAMRRADIDIAYSEGFSPHQIMSFAAPLGVGITSEGEYLDIEVHSSKSSKEALKALNEVMVEGVEVLEYRELKEGTKNAMSSVAAADYLVSFKNGTAREADCCDTPASPQNTFGSKEGRIAAVPGLTGLSEALKSFYRGQSEILITKQTKKSEKVMDLKPLIYELKAVDVKTFKASRFRPETEEDGLSSGNECPGFFLKVCTGSTDNVKPELVLSAFSDYCENTGACSFRFEPMQMQLHRVEVYAKESGKFVPLGALGRNIE